MNYMVKAIGWGLIVNITFLKWEMQSLKTAIKYLKEHA